MKAILLIAGVLALAMGLLWVGQGTGYVHWPRTSFMIDDMHWAYYGAGLAVFGVVLIVFSRRK